MNLPSALAIDMPRHRRAALPSAHPRKAAHRLPFKLTKEILSEPGVSFHFISLGNLGSSNRCPGLVLKETATEPDLHVLS